MSGIIDSPTRRLFTRETDRDKAAKTLTQRGLVVTCFNVSDGSGTVYGLEYQPNQAQ